ncbi:unnamed protein product [Ixodes persulcatus]
MSPAVRQRFDRDDTENGMCRGCGFPATTRPLVWDSSVQSSEHSPKTAPGNTDWRPSTTGCSRARPNRSTCRPSLWSQLAGFVLAEQGAGRLPRLRGRLRKSGGDDDVRRSWQPHQRRQRICLRPP